MKQEDWISKDTEVVWHPFTQLHGKAAPLMVTKAEGLYLHTDDGRKIMDAISSWWVNLHGHGHPHIAQAVAHQARELEHVIFAGFTHAPAIDLAEKVLSLLPGNQSKVFYSDNGSTAVEVGLKMAFQYHYNQNTDRKKVIAFHGAYHGDTFGSMSIGDRGPFSAPFAPFLFDVEFLDFPDGNNDEAILQHFQKLCDTEEVAAFVFEPLVLGSAGMKIYAAATLDRMIAYAQGKGTLCIADEVFTGFGRTGKNFACDYLEHQPDIFALSKGLTGGTMALGLTTCTEKIIDAYRSSDIMKTFFHGHSFTANPIACAASIASYELFIREECQAAIQRIARQQASFCQTVQQHPKVRMARCLGTIMAFDIATEEDTSYVNEVRHKLYPYFLERNILLRPLGNTIYVLPPYIITEEELQQVYTVILEMLKEV